MKLQNPPSQYSPFHEMARNGSLERMDAQNHKRGQDIEVGKGRLIMTDVNGVRYNVYVDTSGALQVTAL
jgi:hypothetical protein